jgi:hypothetical protein
MGHTPSQPSRGRPRSAGDDEHERQHRDSNRNHQHGAGIHFAFLPLLPQSHSRETGNLVATSVFVATCWRSESKDLLLDRAKTWTVSYARYCAGDVAGELRSRCRTGQRFRARSGFASGLSSPTTLSSNRLRAGQKQGHSLAETPSFGSSGASKKPGERTEWRSPVSPKRKIGLVVRIDWGVEGATSGLPTQLTVFAIRLDGQLISGYRAYWDRGTALEAAGLSE